ncbi:MAG: NAD(P)-dependent oxidoreductase [Desulfobacterales bacterium]
MARLTVLGAGVMGRAAARVLLAAGHSVLAYDPAPRARDEIHRIGADLAWTPALAADPADLILMFLPGPSEVEDCVSGSEGLVHGVKPPTLVVDMSTVDPGTTERMSAGLEPIGVDYLDAPVLGRPDSVGRWVLPVGGKAAAIDRARPVLQCLAGSIVHAGPCGSGNKIKLLNQLMFGAINAVTAEMMAVSSKIGMDPRLVYETISASNAATVSGLFKELGSRIAEDRYDSPTFTVELLEKDVRLAVQMAVDHHAPPVLGRAIQFLNEAACSQGAGKLDTAFMWQCVRRFWTRQEEQATNSSR